MIHGKFIQLKKLTEVPQPKFASGDPMSYQYGDLNPGVSVPVGYTVKGILISDVRIGERIVIDCSERDGEPFTGIMETSVIQDIRNGKIYTDNSVYELTEL